MKNISLIELFENKPVQDVGTFNSIFKQTPILGFKSDCLVQINELRTDRCRRITVDGNDIFLDIYQASPKEQRKKQIIVKRLKKVSNTNKIKLPNLFRDLKPSEFLVYEAIKFLGSVDGIEELSRQTSINRKTISLNVKTLKKMNLISTQIVSSSGQPLMRMQLTQ